MDPTHGAMRAFTLAFVFLERRVLLMHRSPDKAYMPNIWNGLGGKIEPGETPAEAVQREVWEESGLDIEPAFRGTLTWVDSAGDDGTLFIYTATLANTPQLKSNHEGHLQFHDIDSLKQLQGLQNNIDLFLPRLYHEPHWVMTALCHYDSDTLLLYKDDRGIVSDRRPQPRVS